MSDYYGLDEGWRCCVDGFNDIGLTSVPLMLREKIEPHESLSEYIMDKLPDSHYWAPEIRHELIAHHSMSHIFELVRLANIEMSNELARRVESNEWTDDEAKVFATEKAGKLLLALFGKLRSS